MYLGQKKNTGKVSVEPVTVNSLQKCRPNKDKIGVKVFVCLGERLTLLRSIFAETATPLYYLLCCGKRTQSSFRRSPTKLPRYSRHYGWESSRTAASSTDIMGKKSDSTAPYYQPYVIISPTITMNGIFSQTL